MVMAKKSQKLQLYELINLFLNDEVNVKESVSLSSSPFHHCASHLPIFFFPEITLTGQPRLQQLCQTAKKQSP